MSTTTSRSRKLIASIVSGVLATALSVIAPSIANAVVPTEVNIRLSTANKAAMTDKTYWWTDEAASYSWLKFVTIGDTLTLDYTVTDTSNNPVSGAEVVLATTNVNSSFSGALTGTTDSNGQVTFTLTNTNAAGASEPRPVAPSSMTYWDDTRNPDPQYKFDINPSVTGATTNHIDRVWTHIVDAAPRVYTYDVANVKLTSADVSKMSDKSYWWNEGAGSRSLVKFLSAGSTLTLHYVVTDANSAPIANAAVTLEPTVAHGTPNFSGSLEGTTNSNGEVTFTLVNEDTSSEAEPRPIEPSSMIHWDDATRGALVEGIMVEMDYKPVIDAATITRDRVWVHVVDPSTDPSLSGIALSSGTLSPAFSSATTSYSASVASTVASIDVTPTATDAASITVNGTSVASGTSKSVSLSSGANTITVVSTSEDGETTRTYTLSVTRQSAIASATVTGGSKVIRVSTKNAAGKIVTITMTKGTKTVIVKRTATLNSQTFNIANSTKGTWRVVVKVGTRTVRNTTVVVS